MAKSERPSMVDTSISGDPTLYAGPNGAILLGLVSPARRLGPLGPYLSSARWRGVDG